MRIKTKDIKVYGIKTVLRKKLKEVEDQDGDTRGS